VTLNHNFNHNHGSLFHICLCVCNENDMIAPLLTVAALIGLLPTNGGVPIGGQKCPGAFGTIGTGNLTNDPATLNTPETTIVNSWRVFDKNDEPQGFVHKTFDGKLWYESTVYPKILEVKPDETGAFTPPAVHYKACFKRDWSAAEDPTLNGKP